MSKAEKFEMEGKVLEKLPNAMFQVELEWSSGAGSYQRKASYELYPYPSG